MELNQQITLDLTQQLIDAQAYVKQHLGIASPPKALLRDYLALPALTTSLGVLFGERFEARLRRPTPEQVYQHLNDILALPWVAMSSGINLPAEWYPPYEHDPLLLTRLMQVYNVLQHALPAIQHVNRLAQPTHILNIGTGLFADEMVLAQLAPHAHIHSITVSPVQHQMALLMRDYLGLTQRVSVYMMDLLLPQFQALCQTVGGFDAISMKEVLGHFPSSQRPAIVHIIHDALKTQGIFCLTDTPLPAPVRPHHRLLSRYYRSMIAWHMIPRDQLLQPFYAEGLQLIREAQARNDDFFPYTVRALHTPIMRHKLHQHYGASFSRVWVNLIVPQFARAAALSDYVHWTWQKITSS